MNLREWISSSDDVNKLISPDDKAHIQSTNVLGHIWDTKGDTICLKSNSGTSSIGSDIPTKRSILKEVVGTIGIIFAYMFTVSYYYKSCGKNIWTGMTRFKLAFYKSGFRFKVNERI